jgi:hypothetical protein
MLSYDELLARKDAPAGSNWGLFGESDELGMVNVLTSERVLAGARCVQRGASFNLDLPLELDPPVSPSGRGAPQHTITRTSEQLLDDYVDKFYLQGSTQIDGLRHVKHPDHGFYNGHSEEEISPGSATLGVSRWAERGIVGRGVVLDVAGFLADRGEPLDPREARQIPVAVLDECARAEGVELRGGDLILMHTGWVEYLMGLSYEERLTLPRSVVSPGLAQDESTLRWLWERQTPLIASDNLAVECYPPRTPPYLSTQELSDGPKAWHNEPVLLLHRHIIAMLGIVVGELWKLGDLCRDSRKDGVWECLLVVKPLNLRGGVGSPANAIAIK